MTIRYYEIPTPRATQPISTQISTLSGQSYRIDFTYNTRRELWELSLFDSNETPIIYHAAILHGADILSAIVTDIRPPGSIVCIAQNEIAPTLDSLSTDKLYYIVDSEAEGEA